MTGSQQAAAATAYDRAAAETYDARRFASARGRAVHAMELARLREAVAEAPRPLRALELGCGSGRLMMELWRDGHAVDGVDASPEMLAIARARAAGATPGPDLRLAEAARLPHADGRYDLVYAVRLLNQTASPAYALRVVDEMLRVARPGGLALVEVLNAERPAVPGRGGVRLRVDEVVARATAAGAGTVWIRGAFLTGMTVYRWLPAPARRLDAALGGLLPRRCSRAYVLLRKGR